MKLILCDPRSEIQTAWKVQFVEHPHVEIHGGSVLETPADAFLLPGNSFGFLDTGLELEVAETSGIETQDELRRRIGEEHDGELLVGQALVLRLSGLTRPMVYAPVWRTPRKLTGTVNVFLAVRGALLALQRDPESSRVASLALPALGIDPGELDPRISARQIRYAYEVHEGLRGRGDKNLTQQTRRERKLMSIPGINKEGGGERGETD
jgi:O-acetyl-ADP-ribose deacetylase (regulator of RNase III)